MLMRLATAVLFCLAALPALAQQQRPQPAPAQQGPQVTIKNDGEVQLEELYVVRGGTGARDWGADRFGPNVVPAGQNFRLRLPAGFGCSADIRIVFEDGEEDVRERVNICQQREVSFARAAAASAAAEREVVIENASPRDIQVLFISATTETEWGEDRLGSETIAPGARFTARFPDNGCSYDVRVVFDNGGAEERRRVDLCEITGLAIAPGWTTAENVAAAAAGGPAPAVGGQVAIVNRSGRTVFELFVYPDGASERGPDRLGSDTMADGSTIRVPAAQAPACAQTVWLSYDDGQREERSGIDLCTTAEIVIAPGWTGANGAATVPSQRSSPGTIGVGTVGVVNRSGRTVFEMYSFPDGASDEGPDRLGSDVLRDGGSVRIPSARAPNCASTVRISYDTGEREERSGIDLCTLTELVIAPGWTESAMAGAARILNAGTTPIIALYADPPGTPRGPDRLGDHVLGVGEAFGLGAPQQGVCAYDVTAQFRDGRTARVAGADLCTGTEIRMAP